jgi:hypothetical protein
VILPISLGRDSYKHRIRINLSEFGTIDHDLQSVSLFSYGSPSFMFCNVPQRITSGPIAGLT